MQPDCEAEPQSRKPMGGGARSNYTRPRYESLFDIAEAVGD